MYEQHDSLLLRVAPVIASGKEWVTTSYGQPVVSAVIRPALRRLAASHGSGHGPDAHS
jgi:hypothetical protein